MYVFFPLHYYFCFFSITSVHHFSTLSSSTPSLSLPPPPSPLSFPPPSFPHLNCSFLCIPQVLKVQQPESDPLVVLLLLLQCIIPKFLRIEGYITTLVILLRPTIPNFLRIQRYNKRVSFSFSHGDLGANSVYMFNVK